jgi:hypothetical protein
MIRPGKSIDAAALADIVIDGCARSRYAGHVDVEPKLARQLFAQAAMKHGFQHDGGMFLMVNESDGEIDAFMLGTLGRIYIVGDMLAASDVFLLGREGCDPYALRRLFSAYIEWAQENPKVFEIGASWADTIPGAQRSASLFRSKGFTLCGETWRRPVQASIQEEAA